MYGVCLLCPLYLLLVYSERILGGRKDSVFIRRGSRINTDRFPNRLRKAQLLRGRGMLPRRVSNARKLKEKNCPNHFPAIQHRKILLLLLLLFYYIRYTSVIASDFLSQHPSSGIYKLRVVYIFPQG